MKKSKDRDKNKEIKKEQSKEGNKNPFALFLTGFGMGSADIIPGVSGGTIAFIFQIYEKLIESIKITTGDGLKYLLKADFKNFFQVVPFQFLIPLGLGILTAILLFSKVISWLLKEYPANVWGFFFGLVLISIFIVSKRISKWRSVYVIAFTVAAIITYFIVGAVPVETSTSLPMFFLSGMVAISAMILPGISGSFILLILGKYSQILEAVNNKDLLVLTVFMAGCAVGISIFSRVLGWLFSKYHDIAVAVLVGIMFGSLRKLWPWKEVVSTRINSHGEVVPLVEKNIFPANLNSEVIFVIILCLLGASLMYYFDSLQSARAQNKK
jgi:putative membrane protein